MKYYIQLEGNCCLLQKIFIIITATPNRGVMRYIKNT
jgi:hypothetical protein